MAVRRPSGKQHSTQSGADAVAAPPADAAPPTPPRAGRARRARADLAAADVPDRGDLLDGREARQRPNRKAAGPTGRRVKKDDVTIDRAIPAPSATPTDPE